MKNQRIQWQQWNQWLKENISLNSTKAKLPLVLPPLIKLIRFRLIDPTNIQIGELFRFQGEYFDSRGRGSVFHSAPRKLSYIWISRIYIEQGQIDIECVQCWEVWVGFACVMPENNNNKKHDHAVDTFDFNSGVVLGV